MWFTEQEEIPANERVYFMEHIQKVGGIDEQAAQFIEDNMNMINIIRETQLKNSEAKAKTLLGCINGEKLPKQSAKTRMAETTGAYLNDVSTKAITKLKKRETEENKAQETNQHDQELDAVEELKKSLRQQ